MNVKDISQAMKIGSGTRRRVVVPLMISVLIVVGVLAAMIVFGTKDRPPPLDTISKPFAKVDYADLPALQRYQARDGTALAYRAYPGDSERFAVLVHGSSGHSDNMHPMAKALRAAGYTVYALDIRGHGGSGPHGDIAYVGQLDDDMVDFMGIIRPRHPKATSSLIGFSSGGGFTLRVAGGQYGNLFDQYVLISPALYYKAPTVRPGVGGWVAPYVPRIIALAILDRLGIHALEGLPVLAFATQPGTEQKLVASYSYRLSKNFSPHREYRKDIRDVTKPMAVLVGESDELFYPDKFAPEFQSVRADVPVTVVPGLGHIDMSLSPAAFRAITAALQR